MAESGRDSVKIGRFAIPVETAAQWVSLYTDSAANALSAKPYAYPAYDQYNSDANTATVPTDADFLAPGLLNVPVKVRSFYGMQRVRDRLQAGLSASDLGRPLAELTDERIAALIGSLYSVLDDSDTKPWGVKATTLSKVLHRKRPASIALHDTWVQTCYLGDGAPVPRVKHRSWADYMTLVSVAMARDLRDQPRQFLVLQEASNARPSLSDVRVLDIIAWHRGQGGTAGDVGASKYLA